MFPIDRLKMLAREAIKSGRCRSGGGDGGRFDVALIRLSDAACKAIAEAKSVDEVKDIADKADALRLFSRQAKNKTLEVDAAEPAEGRAPARRNAGRERAGKRRDWGREAQECGAGSVPH